MTDHARSNPSDSLSPSRETLDLETWVQERLDNCERIAAMKTGAYRDGWLEDAAYFRQLTALTAQLDGLATRADQLERDREYNASLVVERDAQITALTAQLRLLTGDDRTEGSLKYEQRWSEKWHAHAEKHAERVDELTAQLRARDEERIKALEILATQSGDDLLDACRQVKQAAISEADNSEVADAKYTALEAACRGLAERWLNAPNRFSDAVEPKDYGADLLALLVGVAREMTDEQTTAPRVDEGTLPERTGSTAATDGGE